MADTLPPGTPLFGRYTVSDLLTDVEGERVYRAQTGYGQDVLVTEFFGPREGPEAARARAAYFREARLLMQIQHPGVIRSIDLFEERGTVYLVQEDLGWTSLKQQLEEGLLAPADVLTLARTLYQALSAAHAAPVLHRRLSPERLWKARNGSWVVARFGLGVSALAEIRHRFVPDARYAAPEQLDQDRSIGPSSDVYSLAAVLVEALTGRSLPPASARALGAPMPLFPDATPGALRRALEQALKLDPSERAVSAGEVLEFLNRESRPEDAPEPVVLQAEPDALPATEPAAPVADPPSPAPLPRRGRPWLAPVALGTAVCVGLAFAWGALSPRTAMQSNAVATPSASTDAATAASPTAPAPTPEPTPEPVEPVLERVVGTQDLPLLDGPDGATLRNIAAGTPLDVVEHAEGWVRITGSDKDGWVRSDHLLTVHTDAETQALEAELQSGGEVTIPAGVYELRGPLTLSGGGKVTGAGLTQTILISDAGEDTLVLEGGTFSFSGLTVIHRGSAPARTLLASGTHVILSDVRLSGAVRDEEQKSYGSGLWLKDGSSAEVTGSQLTGNAYGLYVSDTSSATVSGSALSNNTDGGGLFMDQATGTLSDNVIEGNGAHGLHIRGNATPLVKNNTIRRNGQRGLTIFEQAAPDVEENTVERNGYQGVGVQDQATPTLSGNSIRYNRQSGVTYFAQSGGTLRDNVVSNNARSGVSVTQDAEPELNGNTIEGNGENGLSYSDRAGGSASGNTIRLSGKPGIAAWGSAHPDLSGNTITQSRQSGVVLAENVTGSFSGNTVEQNTLYGLIITGSAAPQSSGNTVSGNTKGGIYYKQSAGGTSEGNVCTGNGGPDMQVALTEGSVGPVLMDLDCVPAG